MARSRSLVIFFLCLFFSSGIGTARTIGQEENQEMSSYDFSTKLDSVPVVNPTTPGTANPYPTINPTPPQSPYTTGQTPTTPYMTPTTTPTSPTTPKTSPTTTPTNPYTTPTTTTPTNPYTTPTSPTTSSSSGGQWCIASQSAAESTLKVALDYACGYGADCSAIQQGGTCYNPNTLRDHASYAFNDYYQKNPAPTSCAFGGTATLTNKDPSNGNCHYTSSKTPSMTTPPTFVSPPNPPSTTMTPTPPTSMTPTPPSTLTPTTPTLPIPGGTSSVYGSAPIGTPNTAATSASSSLLLLLAIFGISASLHIENYI